MLKGCNVFLVVFNGMCSQWWLLCDGWSCCCMMVGFAADGLAATVVHHVWWQRVFLHARKTCCVKQGLGA